MTPQQQEVLRLKDEEGLSYAEIAARLGRNQRTIERQVKTARQARERMQNIDPAIQDSMRAAGTNMVPALAWAKTKNEEGTSYSVLLKPDQDTTSVAERIRDALEGMKPLPRVKPPKDCDSDLLTVYCIADAHIGMYAWAQEAGEDYNTDAAAHRINEWMSRLVDAAPAAETAVVLDVGDLTHADNDTAMTPTSGHVLDVDTRFWRTIDITIQTMARAAERALEKHKNVLVRILPGNHNISAYLAITFALAERWRENPRIEVQKDPSEFWAYEFGRCLVAAHHGHRAKAQKMVLFLADEYPEIWGRTHWRYLFTGHLHHHKAEDIGGVLWRQLRAVAPRDAYAYSNAYASRSQASALTFHKERGEISSIKVGA